MHKRATPAPAFAFNSNEERIRTALARAPMTRFSATANWQVVTSVALLSPATKNIGGFQT